MSGLVILSLNGKHKLIARKEETDGTLADMGVMHSSGWQGFFSLAGMVAVITSVLAGSLVGLLLAAFSLPLVVTVNAGVVAFLVSVGLHQLYQWRNWLRLGRDLPARFPGKQRKVND